MAGNAQELQAEFWKAINDDRTVMLAWRASIRGR